MHRHDAVCFVHTFPLFHSMPYYAYHACLCHLLAIYASLHTCLYVHAWVLLVSVSSISTQWSNGHPIQTYICPSRTPSFVCFLLVCLLTSLLAFLLLCLPCLSCLSTLCLFICFFASFPSIACMLVSCLCLCMYTHGARTHGARARFPKRKQKRRGCEHVNISQAVVFSRFRVLAFPIWLCTFLNPFLPLPFLS